MRCVPSNPFFRAQVDKAECTCYDDDNEDFLQYYCVNLRAVAASFHRQLSLASAAAAIVWFVGFQRRKVQHFS